MANGLLKTSETSHPFVSLRAGSQKLKVAKNHDEQSAFSFFVPEFYC
ncbi:MAG TPA: hypothetical protein VKW70_08050 [Terriglobia bacterium]|nr:hypothetical protein [Terriglobia bacterium]